MRKSIAAGLITAWCAASLPMTLPSSAFAQEISADSKLEEVVVSARKKTENAIDVPISIDTVTASQIANLDLESIEDITKFTPGMFTTDGNYTRADRLYNAYTIRGLALNNYNNLADSAIVFVDGAPNTTGNLPGVTDIERVEVLKGPQAAYFGRNTFSGAISVTTREPSNTWEARAFAEGSSYDSSDLALSVEGPLIEDKLLVRVSVESRTKGGEYYDWEDPSQRLGGQSTHSVAATLKFMPTDKLTIRGNFNYFVYDDEPGAQVRLINPGNVPGEVYPNSFNCDKGNVGYNNWICGVVPQVQPQQILYNFDLSPAWRQFAEGHSIYGGDGIDNHPGLESLNYHGSIKIDYELPMGIQFESITAEDVTRAATISDEWYDPSFPNPDAPYFPGASADWNWLYLVEFEKQNFSEELRLTSAQDQRLRWTVGGNYLLIPVVKGSTEGIVPFGPLYFPNAVDGAHSYAAFGGLYFDVVKDLEFGVEGRYQRDSIFTAYSAVVDGAAQPANISAAFDAFTPRVSLKYKISPDTSVYALYSRGWLPGAINSALIANASVSGSNTATAAQIQAAQGQTGAGLFAQPETLDTGEVGIKTNFLDGRGFLTFDVYGGKVTNEQVQNNFTVPGVGVGSIFYSGSALANQGAVDIDGVETEIAFQVTPELHVQAAYAYNNTKITAGGDSTIASLRGCSGLPTPYPAYCTNVIGNHLPNAPESQGYVDASYTRPINDKLRWFVGANYVYVGTKYADTANYAQTGVQELVNIRFGVSTDTWKLEAWGKNITNNKTPDYLNDQAVNYNNFTGLTASSPFNALEVGLPQKPTYGLRLNYRL